MSHKHLKRIASFLGLSLIIAEAGCGPGRVTVQEKLPPRQDLVALQEKLLSRRNPTAYVFGDTLENVHGAIQRAFAEHFWKDAEPVDQASKDPDSPFGAKLVWRESVIAALCDGVFEKQENANDAFLFGMPLAFGKSQIYFKNDLPLTYFADFHIHLTPIGPSKTRVEIFTYHPWVSAGLDPSAPEGPAYIMVDVEPTTIEEYGILLKIGQQLGVKNMPELIVPGPNAAVRQIVRPLKR